MRVVGIDQSYTNFGYSVDGDAKKKAFPASKYNDDPTKRLLAVEDWLCDWLDRLDQEDQIDLVVMEGYASAAKFGREMAGELGWAVKRSIYQVVGEPALIVPPTSLKKFISGSGGAKKNTMLMHVFKRWGVEFSDDNQADAFALEKFGLAYLEIEHHGPTQDYPKFQVEAVKAVAKPK